MKEFDKEYQVLAPNKGIINFTPANIKTTLNRLAICSKKLIIVCIHFSLQED